MNILVVVGHPNPESFNHAIAQTVADSLRECGHTVTLRDLTQEKFDPCLPTDEIPQHGTVDPQALRYATELAEADGIVVIHPNWWGAPPAIMKGWIDRAFRPGKAYNFVEGDGGEGVPVGLLKAKSAIIFNTSNTEGERENRVFGDPLERIWKDCIFSLCGVTDVQRTVFRIVVTSTNEERAAWLSNVRDTVRRTYGS